jgi:hypothetical protein
MNEIDQQIKEGLHLIQSDPTSKPQLTSSDNADAWRKFLEMAKFYLPESIKHYLMVGNSMIPSYMPPKFICDYHDWRIIYDRLAPIRVHFSVTSDSITYEVPVYEPLNGSDDGWDWGRAVIYSDLTMALGDARRQYNMRDHMIHKFAVI